MTQEERNAKWDKLINPQQPIPQDINKLSEDKIYWCNKFIEADNLNRSLQSQLQQQQEANDVMGKVLMDRDGEIEQQAAEIELLKQEILRLKEQHNKWAKIYNDRLDNQP